MVLGDALELEDGATSAVAADAAPVLELGPGVVMVVLELAVALDSGCSVVEVDVGEGSVSRLVFPVVGSSVSDVYVDMVSSGKGS